MERGHKPPPSILSQPLKERHIGCLNLNSSFRGNERRFAAAATAVLQLLSAVLQPLPAFAASAAANFAVLQPVSLPILQPLPAVASTAPVVTRDIGESSKFPQSGGVGLSIGPLLLKQMEDEAEEEAVPLGHTQKTVHQAKFIRAHLVHLHQCGKQPNCSGMSL